MGERRYVYAVVEDSTRARRFMVIRLVDGKWSTYDSDLSRQEAEDLADAMNGAGVEVTEP